MAKLAFNETIRNISQPFLLPIVKILDSWGIHPNTVTITCLMGFLISSIFIAYGKLLLGGIFLLLFAPLDAIDGLLARYSKKVTSFGAFLDSTLDRYGEIFLFLAFTYYFLNQNSIYGVILSFLAITGSLMVSYTRARAEGVGFDCKIGLLTRFERIFLLIVALIFDLCIPLLVFIAIFTHFTALQRIIYIYKTYKSRG
ncbi:MAG: Phosphatidylglycerophosphate synthase [Thermodesulfobacteria bacterium]|nr:CDP-alcohol phosphatidyltransferase family protein [Thermodesulfobacteriota bacterium]MCU4138956.1 Phosphatidylglycerophosphate synthase [Thermodesulfobacteriota bacterium]